MALLPPAAFPLANTCHGSAHYDRRRECVITIHTHTRATKKINARSEQWASLSRQRGPTTPRVPFGLVVLARLRKWLKCVCAALVEAWYHWCVCQKQTITEKILWRRERIFFKTYLKLQLPDSAHLPSCLSLTFSSFLSCFFSYLPPPVKFRFLIFLF